MRTSSSLGLVSLFLLALGQPATARQRAATAPVPRSPSWGEGFHISGANGEVQALAIYDDGRGPKLYAGGTFGIVGQAITNGIACWDGERWSAVGGDGTGIASPPQAPKPEVTCMVVHDDGSGARLYVGGFFDSIGGLPIRALASWDGSTWSSPGDLGSGRVQALHAQGSSLYVGGSFSAVGAVSANNVARWDGSQWFPIDNGIGGPVTALSVATVAGVTQPYAGVTGRGLMRWNGEVWSPVPGGQGSIQALANLKGAGDGILVLASAINKLRAWNGVHVSEFSDDAPRDAADLLVDEGGPGEILYVGARITGTSGTQTGLSAWDGSGWQAIGEPSPGTGFYQDVVQALAVGSVGTGPRELFVGGDFDELDGSVALNVARSDGAEVSSIELGQGFSPQLGAVGMMTTFDAGGGPELYVSTSCDFAGSLFRHRGLARWTGKDWRGVGPSFAEGDLVFSTVEFDDGTGTALHAVGRLTSVGGQPLDGIARWDGTRWTSLGPGPAGLASILVATEVYDAGSGAELHVAGEFTSMGGVTANGVARWNGVTWAPLGEGITEGRVEALEVHDDGAGPELYAAGDFLVAGGLFANGIACWDGVAWAPLPGGVNAPFDSIETLLGVDLPAVGGSVLVVGGGFQSVGSLVVNGIATWDGSRWRHLDRGFGATASVRSLVVHDDGTGPALYAGGNLGVANRGTILRHVARWDGTRWRSLRGGLTRISSVFRGFAHALASHGSEGERALWIGGTFVAAGGLASNHIARWARAELPLVDLER